MSLGDSGRVLSTSLSAFHTTSSAPVQVTRQRHRPGRRRPTARRVLLHKPFTGPYQAASSLAPGGGAKQPKTARRTDLDGCAEGWPAQRRLDDLRMTQVQRTEKGVVRLQQCASERQFSSRVKWRRRASGAHSVEVGVHIGAAEGIDRLFGVADQHQPGATSTGTAVIDRRAGSEGLLYDLPLDRVGVLELVRPGQRVAPGRRAQAAAPRRGFCKASASRTSKSS